MMLFLPYRSLSVKKRATLFVLLSLFLLSLAFIFYNSSLPPAESSEESGKVGGFLALIFPEGAPFTEFLLTNLREIAHFAEFFILGVFSALMLVLFSYRPMTLAAASVIFGHLVGFLDETVQIFSGRGPEITDVWLDTLGYFTATALVIITHFAATVLRRKKEK